MLIIAQVVLALQLPFTLIPLIKITSSRSHMGAYANSRVIQSTAWGAALLIFSANMLLCMEMIWPTSISNPEAASHQISKPLTLVGSIEDLSLQSSVFRAVEYAACVAGTAAGLSLLLWMIVTPLGSRDQSSSKASRACLTTASLLSPCKPINRCCWWLAGPPDA